MWLVCGSILVVLTSSCIVRSLVFVLAFLVSLLLLWLAPWSSSWPLPGIISAVSCPLHPCATETFQPSARLLWTHLCIFREFQINCLFSTRYWILSLHPCDRGSNIICNVSPQMQSCKQRLYLEMTVMSERCKLTTWPYAADMHCLSIPEGNSLLMTLSEKTFPT